MGILHGMQCLPDLLSKIRLGATTTTRVEICGVLLWSTVHSGIYLLLYGDQGPRQGVWIRCRKWKCTFPKLLKLIFVSWLCLTHSLALVLGCATVGFPAYHNVLRPGLVDHYLDLCHLYARWKGHLPEAATTARF